MTGLTDTILSAIPAGTVASLAGQFGESASATQSALGGVVPTILAAIASRTQSGGSATIADLTRTVLASGNPLDAVAAGGAPTVPLGQANGILETLLGPQLPTIASTLAGAFGLKGDSILGLLSFAAPLVLGGIGRALHGDVTPSGVSTLFERERPSILAALPAGLGSLFGLGSGAAHSIGNGVIPQQGGSGRWMVPLLLGLAVLLALLFALSRCQHQASSPLASDNASFAPTETVTETPAAIPTGAGVTTETRSGKPVAVVYFETGKADVSPDFSAASAGLKTYLDQNATGKLTVSGFNDPTGNAALNAALSKKRAEAVKAALVAQGISADKIELVKPADTTDTSTSMANARRVEVVAQ